MSSPAQRDALPATQAQQKAPPHLAATFQQEPAAQPASLFPSEKISPLHQRVLGSAQPPTHATPLPWPALRSPPPPSASRLSSGLPATQESVFPSGDPTEFRRSRQAPRLSPAVPFLTVRGLRVNSY